MYAAYPYKAVGNKRLGEVIICLEYAHHSKVYQVLSYLRTECCPKKDRDGVKVALNIPRLSPKGNMVTLFLCTSSGESQGMSYTVLMFCIVQQFTLRDNPGFTQDEMIQEVWGPSCIY